MEQAYSIVLETLTQATSQNADVLKPAEVRLSSWETEPGFYPILQSVFLNHSVDINIRWLAVVYLKNGIDRYWRKTAPNAISEAEKASIRKGLLSRFDEPVNQIAVQVAVLVAKIARHDCAREWPELVPTLLSVVRSDVSLVQHRALLTLHHVAKALSAKRLAGDRRVFQELTASIFNLILNLWNTFSELFLKQATEQGSEPLPALEKTLLSLKVLRCLVVQGFKKPHECQDVILFLTVIYDRIKIFLQLRKSVPAGQMLDLLEKLIVLHTKVLGDVLEQHPFSFIHFIRPTLDFVGFYLFSEIDESLLFENFVIKCLNLVKGILICAEYRPAKIIEDTKDPLTLEAYRVKCDFFVEPIVTQMIHRLVTHYFLLTRQDLEVWDSDPEGYACDETGESWRYSLRPCTECLFLSLVHEYRGVVTPVILSLVRENVDVILSMELSVILRKEALYNAAGLAAFDLFDEVDFDQWFLSGLLPELQIKDSNYRIVRRRVAWLIGQWTGVKLSPELRPQLYAAVLPLLRNSEDLVVRLAAANTLKVSVDDFDFCSDQFLPFLPEAFDLLFQLLKEVRECDTKMHVLHVMSFVVERMGVSIRPLSEGLIQYLPALWEDSAAADHNMLRCAILTTFIHLVQGLGTSSSRLYPYLIPILQLSTDEKLPAHVYLLEDGLELWLAVLENCASICTPLLHIYSNILPLLEYQSENLRTCLFITQAYILLCPDEFLSMFGSSLVKTCVNIITDMNSEGVVMVMRLMELAMRSRPVEAANVFRPLLPWVFRCVYEGDAYPMVMSMYLSIVARLFLISHEMTAQIVADVGVQLQLPNDSVLAKIMDVWLDKITLVTQLERRKLLGLALAGLLAVPTRIMMDRLCGILLGIVEVLNDITKTDDLGNGTDSLVVTDPTQIDLDDLDYETEHDQRKRTLSMSDPVHTITLRDIVQEQLNKMRIDVGEKKYEELMSDVDVETMSQLKEYFTL